MENRQEELEALIGGLCNGTLDEAFCARLDALLRSDAAARQFYNDYLFLHAELYSQHANAGAFGCQLSAVGEREAGGDSVESWLAEVIPVNETSPPRSRKRRWVGWLAMAAALVGVAAVSSWLTYAATRGVAATEQVAGGGAAEAGAGTPRLADEAEGLAAVDVSQTVAKITATRNCLWQSPERGVGFGSRLHPGQRLHLEAGLIEITFDDGAKVVLEGPARFDVRASGEARLHEGRLAAVVPAEARGFAVATSRLNVVDLGTEFGVVADAEGTTEVHVFNGLVEAHLLDERGQQIRTVALNTAEAARLQPALAMVARIPARDEEFVRTLSVASGPHDGLYAYEGFNYPSGPLAEQNGGFGWGGPWFNLAAEESSGDAHTSGVQIGSLEYDGMVPLGNRAVQSGHQNRIRRALSTSIGGVFDAAGLIEEQDGMRLVGRDGTAVYLSFLQRVDRTGDVFYGFELHRGDGNPNRVLSIGHGAEDTGYGATSNYNVYGPRNFPSLGEEDTEVNFFVIRITFGAGNRDRVEVMRNPASLSDEHACRVDAVLTGNFAFDRISIANFHGTKVHEIDEIRVGTTFRAVTGRRSRGPDRLQRSVAWGSLGSREGWWGGNLDTERVWHSLVGYGQRTR